ncbi:MAG: hydrogenase maturation nickel metallochaperone HypA [Oceanospirillaceae bacterium]|nr:hydrogenase maturation nickel metallochaperone HypA [Oceanospirillaceae bacterium]|tara:strand:+ start:245 stop:586 length:342 start_codon:yes stop_codon:yes gene_type:complete
MHEMSLCEGILQVLENSAEAQGFQRVKSVWLEIGQLAGVEQSALEFSFDVVTRGTLAENAALNIINIPADAWCLPCAKAVEIHQRFDPCPDCGSHQLQVQGGDEMRIKELEVE